MRYQLARIVVASGLWLAMLANGARGQIQMPVGPSGPSAFEQDVDVFAPAEMDIDGLPIGFEDRGGYFLNYDKVVWSIEGGRTTVGDKQVQRAMPPVWMDRLKPDNPLTSLPGLIFPALQPIDPVTGRPRNPDTDNFIQRPIFQNSIQETAPDSRFVGGDRIEFGFNTEGNGWMVSILNGPDQQTGQLFGINGGSQEDTIPVSGLQSPLGDVYIAFNYDEGLMHGFQDMWISDLGTGRVLPADINADGIADGDGFADDLDGDGQYGPDGLDIDDPAQEPDSFPVPAGALFPTTSSGPPDYDDLVELPTAWRTVLIRNASTINGVELMGTYRFNNRHFQAKNQHHNVYLYYGARYLRFRDNFVVNAEGGVMGLSSWDTQIINNLVGPQLGVNWTQQRGRWSADLNGRFMFGYNVSNWRQDGAIGEDLIPGRHNHPLYLRPRTFKYGRRDDEFSPVAEMRLNFAYHMTKSIALSAGWSGTYIGQVFRASTQIKYTLPDMGFALNDAEHIIVNGGNIGLQFNY